MQTVGAGCGAGAVGTELGIATEVTGCVVAWCGKLDLADDRLKKHAREQGAAATIAAACRRSGAAFLEGLRGTFALAVIVPDEQRVLLAIDRMGIRSLAYALIPDGIAFASNLDALLAHRAVPGEIDPQAIYNYLFCQMVPAPGAIYKGVRKLLPGQYIEYRDGRITTGFYWQLRYQKETSEPTAVMAERFRGILRESVGSVSDEPQTGTFLSGGTDSSTVTGILSDLRRAPIDAYSIGFDAQGYDEMHYARIAAQRYRVRHHEYYVTPKDVVEAIPLVARAYDEPFGNASAVPTYYCAKRAREDGILTMLAGDGGDEILGGNERYAKQKIFEAYRAIPAAIRAGVIEPFSARLPASLRFAFLRKFRSYVQQARIPLPERLESYNFLLREEPREIFQAGFLTAFDVAQPIQIMREVFERTESHHAIDRMMHLDLKQTLADNDLRKVNRMCHLAGVEVRYPFLEYEVVEFSGQIPARLKVRGLKLRHFFKYALKDFLPPEIIAKRKHGFGLPFGVWLVEHPALHEVAGDSLQAFRKRGYLRPEYIDQLLRRHDTEHASYYGVMVWVIMMLEHWLATHADRAR